MEPKLPSITDELRRYGDPTKMRPNETIDALKEILRNAWITNATLASRLAAVDEGVTMEIDEATAEFMLFDRLTALIKQKWNTRLTAQEMAMVGLLARAGRRPLNRYHLVECLPGQVNGRNEDRQTQIAGVVICKLRKKTEKAAIESVWGSGYRLGEPMATLYAEAKASCGIAKPQGPVYADALAA
jgi:DNA-binding response OmpR family regulator